MKREREKTFLLFAWKITKKSDYKSRKFSILNIPGYKTSFSYAVVKDVDDGSLFNYLKQRVS